ncbi:MAG: alpha-galactosidase, partial [Clostridiales bacterium]|nr:alpha-galactosidase [Clostridiales bacterium]
ERDSAYLIKRVAKVSPALDIASEFGGYARGDFREPTALVERADGGTLAFYRYVRHVVRDGVPALSGLPHARSGGKTLTITLKDGCSDTEIDLNYSVWDDSDVLVRNATIRNTGKQASKLRKAFSFCLDLPDRGYEILRLHGAWARECAVQTEPLGYGVVRLQSLRGVSSPQMNPFMGVLGQGCTETQGECYGVQLIYSGSYALTAERDAYGTVRLQGGVSDVQFGWELDGGKSFVTPQVALCYSAQGLGQMSRAYADFIRTKIVHPKWAFAPRPIVINNWEATYFDFDTGKLCAIIDEAAKMGVNTFVLDDGWFGARNNDDAGLGDWVVNEKKLKGGLKTVIDRCKQNGLKFGLWFEPEMVNPDSDLYRAHPDWAIHKEGVPPVLGRNQLVLDFTRKEVVDHIFAAVSKILRENDISYVKWDMNRFVAESFSAGLPADRQGELMHRYVLGVYDLAERLTSAFPDVFFEGCASGGARFDAGALYYFPQIWTSDDTDAYERARIQWGASVCYPVSAMSCHVSACPNHQTRRVTPISTRGAIASLGATGYELDPVNLTDEEKATCRAQIAAYKEISELVLTGDLYRLLSPFEGNRFCEMLVSKDKRRAYVVGEQLRCVPTAVTECVRLQGLDENKTYRIVELDRAASGKAFMRVGVPLPVLGDYESFVWHLEEVKQ